MTRLSVTIALCLPSVEMTTLLPKSVSSHPCHPSSQRFASLSTSVFLGYACIMSTGDVGGGICWDVSAGYPVPQSESCGISYEQGRGGDDHVAGQRKRHNTCERGGRATAQVPMTPCRLFIFRSRSPSSVSARISIYIPATTGECQERFFCLIATQRRTKRAIQTSTPISARQTGGRPPRPQVQSSSCFLFSRIDFTPKRDATRLDS